MSKQASMIVRERFGEAFLPPELSSLLSARVQQKGAPLRALVRTFGCQQNENDSEKIRGLLRLLGFQPAADYRSADLVLLNTCSIRENADERLFGHLGKLKELRATDPLRIVGVCGCLPTQPAQRQKILNSFSYVHLLFGPGDIAVLPQLLLRVLQGEKQVSSFSGENTVCENLPMVRARRDRALVTIMYGCNNFCSYCVVPHTRGRERSRTAADILQEVHSVADAGISEVMLLGQNVNAWGFDLRHEAKNSQAPLLVSEALLKAHGQLRQDLPALLEKRQDPQDLSAEEVVNRRVRNFGDLLTAVAAVPGIRRVRSLSPHPRDVDASMLAALMVSPEIEDHLHLPLQSGSDRILKAMNRHYSRDRYRQVVAALRQARPGISLTTDLIVAFPGETDEDFQETLDLVEEIGYENAFLFIFSPRPGTPAARMEGVPDAVAHARFERLQNCLEEQSLRAHRDCLEREEEVLIEGVSRHQPNVLTARDHAFRLINLPVTPGDPHFQWQDAEQQLLDEAAYVGKWKRVRITDAKIYSLEGVCLG